MEAISRGFLWDLDTSPLFPCASCLLSHLCRLWLVAPLQPTSLSLEFSHLASHLLCPLHRNWHNTTYLFGGLTFSLCFTLALPPCAGTGTLWIPAIIALWLAPLDYSPAVRGLAFNLLVGFLLDLALIGTSKGLARRTRPKYNREFSVLVPVDVYSFPSGHASR
jgi:hypothetical protein